WERAESEETGTRARMADLDASMAGLEADRAAAEGEEALAGEHHAAAQAVRSGLESELRAALRWEAGARERLNAATGAAGRLIRLEDEAGRTDAALAEVAAAFDAQEAELATAEEAFRARERGRRDLEERHRRAGAEHAARQA